MPSPLPVLYAARHPETGRWLVDADEGFVRTAAGSEGAAVLRVDLAALVRAARASLHMHRASEAAHAAPIGSGDYDAAIDATNAAYEEWRAALAALGDMELLGEEPPR